MGYMDTKQKSGDKLEEWEYLLCKQGLDTK